MKRLKQAVPSQFEAALQQAAGTLAIDLGANVGKYTTVLAARAARVMAFEPDPWAAGRLRETAGNLPNVEIFEAAAGTVDGNVTLYRASQFVDEPDFHSRSSSVIYEKRNVSAEHAVSVPQVDILTVMREIDECIGILKMDAEGAEVPILEALFDDNELLKRIGYIFAETHEKKIPGHEPRVRDLIKRAESMKRPIVNLYWN